MIGQLTEQEVFTLREIINNTLGGSGDQTVTGALSVTGGIGVFGHAPPAVPADVVEPIGGVVVDVQARATINALLTALRATGLVAPPEL